MKKSQKNLWTIMFLVSVVSVGLLTACNSDETSPGNPDTPGLANPASVHCLEMGYERETRKDSQGGEYGVCMFPDGTECSEWAYFREECKPGDTELWEPPA